MVLVQALLYPWEPIIATTLSPKMKIFAFFRTIVGKKGLYSDYATKALDFNVCCGFTGK